MTNSASLADRGATGGLHGYHLGFPQLQEFRRMISALVKWRLAPGITPDQAIERFKQSTHYYAGLPGLVRKYIVINREQRFGYGIYLWHDRKTAEAFYARVTPVIREETGNDPEIEFFDAPIVVDNLTGETLIYG